MGTVRNKLLCVFVLVLAFIAAIGWNGMSKLAQVQETSADVTNKWMYKQETISSIGQAVEQYFGNHYQILLETSPDEKKKLETARDTIVQNIDQSMKQYGGTEMDETDRANYDSLSGTWNSFKSGQSQDELAPLNSMRNTLKMMVMFDHNGAVQSTAAAKKLYDRARSDFVLLGSIALVLIGLIAFLLIRSITRPLKAATTALGRISAGDLTQKPLAVRRKDEFGVLMRAVNAMLAQLQESVRQLQDSAGAVSSSSRQLSSRALSNADSARKVKESFAQVAEGSGNQALYAEECGKVIDDMAIGVQRIAENTSEIAELSKGAADSADDGSGVMKSVSLRMDSLTRSLAAAEETIRRLEQRSDQVGAISSQIGAIAAQTNLLSFNAAIEASRAGEHGRGFAVVAEEVRKLAVQSQESSQDIAERIRGIQEEAAAVAQAMTANVSEIRAGAEGVKEAEHAFAVIVDATANVSHRLQETGAAAELLSASSEEVAASIESMGHLALQTSGMTQQVEAATEEQLASSDDIRVSSAQLTEVAARMQDVVSKFKL